MMQFSLNQFPETVSLKDESGLPWGCCVQPFVPLNHLENNEKETDKDVISHERTNSKLVARCKDCFGYINPFVVFRRYKWKCSLCGGSNSMTSESRYWDVRKRAEYPELKANLVELEVTTTPIDQNDIPRFVALVDITGDDTYLDTVKKGLLAAMEALPSICYFGIITVSDSIGFYDLRSSIPHALYVSIPSDRSCELGIDEILSECMLFVQIESNKDNINMVIESLEGNEASPNGFGTSLSLLVDYFANQSGSKNVRILSFLGSIPSYGLGIVEEKNQKKEDPLLPKTDFYKKQGIIAAEGGVCIDLFAISNNQSESLGLSSLKFLSLYTGGNMFLYENEENCAMPQDVYRQYSRPLAFQGLLRLRTSDQFQVSHHYGSLYADKSYENLFHVAGCDESKTFTFDFEFIEANGFPRHAERGPIVQMAFGYYYVDEDNVVKRILRIHTKRIPVARDFQDIYRGANINPILSILTHKVIRSILDEGITEGQLLLQDWLTILTYHYNLYRIKKEGKKTNERVIDTQFSMFPHLKLLSKMTFSLIKTPLFSLETSKEQDYWSYLHCLYGGLEPILLRKAIYPMLSSYGAVNNLASQQINLTRAAMQTSDCKLFLLDSFHYLIVYHMEENPDTNVFPLPKNSLIRKTLNELKEQRHITPKILLINAGTSDEQIIESHLLEEADRPGGNLSQFLEFIQLEVSKLL